MRKFIGILTVALFLSCTVTYASTESVSASPDLDNVITLSDDVINSVDGDVIVSVYLPCVICITNTTFEIVPDVIVNFVGYANDVEPRCNSPDNVLLDNT